MFGLLKNKLANFISGLSGRQEKKAEDSLSPAPAQEVQENAAQPQDFEKQEAAPGKKEEIKPVTVGESPAKQTVQSMPAAPEVSFPRQEAAPAPAAKPEDTGKPQSRQNPAPEKKSFLSSVAGVFSQEKKPAAPEKKEEKQEAAQKTAESHGADAQKSAKQENAVQKTAPEPNQREELVQKKEKPQQQLPAQTAEPAAARKAEMAGKKPAQPLPLQMPQQPPIASPQTPAQPSPDLSRLEKKAHAEKREMAPKIGLGTAIKSFFSSEITIGEGEVADLLEELELSLLEADVAYEVSSEVTAQLRSQLVGMKVPKGQLEQKTKETIRLILESVMESDRKFDFISRVRGLGKPAKILFVGPNGAGKTTTMAKIARMLMDANLSVVFSASDTFRAAAIEQTEVHGGKLGVKTIKSKYGADPSSVAFDAINYARASSIDVVLIDSAGRQDTNANLLSELVKINRVAQPDLKIYVGESIGGNSVIDQIRAFNTAIGMDGAILTKIDCDAKGGTAISIAKATGIPVIFLGVGQGYSDLVPFDAHKIASEIMN